MTNDGDAPPPTTLSEVHQMLDRLADFNQQWFHSELPDHLDLFLADLQSLLNTRCGEQAMLKQHCHGFNVLPGSKNLI